MGLLDDAIREHLDLKRRRGADPAEVQRAEHEALGPVRRGPVEAGPPELVLDEGHQPEWEDDYEEEYDAPAAAQAGGAAPYLEPEAPLEPRAAIVPEPFQDEDDPFGEDGSFEPEAPPTQAAPRYAEPEYLDEPEPEEVPFDEPAPPPHRAPLPPRDQHGETVEYDVEEALGEPGAPTAEPARPPAQKPPEGADEDPLEETPEFLQETPDHDRLWFEQRPPRDFDFDG